MKLGLGRVVSATFVVSGILAVSGCGGSGEAAVAGGSTPPAPTPPATYSATVSWSVPLLNTDGTSLSDITGYRVYYGTDASDLTQLISVAGAGLTSHVVSNLSPGTYYFAVATLNATGDVSGLSNVASKTVP